MIMVRLVKIRSFQTGLKYQNGKLQKKLEPGWHLIKTVLGESVEILNEKELFLYSPERF